MRRLLSPAWIGLLVAPVLIAVAVGATGCDLIAFVDRSKIPVDDGGTSTTGAGGATSGTSASSGTGAVACVQVADCPAGDDCKLPTCVAGACGVSFADAGAPTSVQIGGDCQRSVCDGHGAAHLVEDDADVPVDGNPCTDDVCTAGVPSNPSTAAGAPCHADGGAFCDGAGHCVGCVTAAQCSAGLTCDGGACVTP